MSELLCDKAYQRCDFVRYNKNDPSTVRPKRRYERSARYWPGGRQQEAIAQRYCDTSQPYTKPDVIARVFSQLGFQRPSTSAGL